MNIVISWYLCSISTAFSLVSLHNLASMNNTHTKRDICSFGVLLLTVMFQRLLEAEASVAYKDIVDLFKIKIDMVVMMRILAPVLFALLLLRTTYSWPMILLRITLFMLLLIRC